MSKKAFGILITAIIIISIVVLGALIGVSSQNKAINLEEQIQESSSSIEVQEKRRADLILNLVDTVENYDEHESGTLTGLAEARSQASQGNVEEARTAIQAVAEAYPDLKSVDNYKTLMNELSTTENLIAEYRNNYNVQVKQYNKHVRVFPNTFFLNLMGYEKIDVDYLEYEAPSDAPTDLFNKE
ncbi:LemA family protein [Heyndrickxia sporothermodurans]|uniref:LemA family protein n=1 Tax=Heyndrickxia sporothermodurans TaxID=46224 RepID=UPI000D335A1D|nr:LemA family protein [Heyndrickxia sporothermodurans]PTY93039.1 LemA family protein [Heyndrickxia sporothermodurans]